MKICLLRHGETDWNLQGRCQGVTDLDLNETGVRQARGVGAFLSKEKIDAVYSSNLKRATQTAHAISKHHGLEVKVRSDLREMDHGIFEGLTFKEIRANYPEFIGPWREQPAHLPVPGGECIADVEKRTWKGIEEIERSHPSYASVVVVSHQFPIVTVLCRITGTPLNDYRRFHVDPSGLTHISYHPHEGWKLIQHNDLSHARAANSEESLT
jgi:broad specificity phosphatase PhoE